MTTPLEPLEEDILLVPTVNEAVVGLPISVVYDPNPDDLDSVEGMKDLKIAQAFYTEHHICLVVTDK